MCGRRNGIGNGSGEEVEMALQVKEGMMSLFALGRSSRTFGFQVLRSLAFSKRKAECATGYWLHGECQSQLFM